MMAPVSRLAKLKAMSPREIGSRLAYKAYVMGERERWRRGLLGGPDRLRRALVPSIGMRVDWQDALASRQSRARYFQSLDSPDRVRDLFNDRYAEENHKARRLAADAARGEIAFFGRQFSFGSNIDWHADPVTGSVWPRVYHGDVPVSGGNVGFGDVKYVWEINRHQFFIDLAKVAFLDRSSEHADVLHRMVHDWMTKVPYGTGAAWACALEPAFRAWSWMWAYHLLDAGGLLDRDTRLMWLTGFSDHGRFLYRHLERYSSPYNHLVGEASALFALGLLFPEFRASAAWVARGKDVLESTLTAQFHADGGSVEQSSFYHHATLGFYILAALLGRRNSAELSPAVWKAIERGIEFSASLVQPDGRVPRLGGADDGKPIRMEHLPFWDFRPYQAIGAVLFSRADFRFVANRFWEDALWLLGPDAADAFDRLEAATPATACALSSSGYYVVRSDWSAAADYLCFDCGEQAAGLRRDDIPSAAHGHADCLSIVLGLGGREVLVDPGFFCYNGDPSWEVHFRKTRAHNTITVDDDDQARHVSKMAWTRTYTPRVEGWSPEDLGWAAGSHDGYARTARGVTHRRTAWLRPGGYAVIRDELRGEPGHAVQVSFQFAAGLLDLNEPWALFDGRYELMWLGTAHVTARAECGGESPSAGWIAPSLGVRQPAPRLQLSFSMDTQRVVLLTVVADRHRAAARTRRVSAPAGDRSGLLRVLVAGDGFADEVFAAVADVVKTPDIDADASLVVVRRTDGGVSAAQAGGTHVLLKTETDMRVPPVRLARAAR